MSAIWHWIIDLFTSGAIIIIGIYLLAPAFHLLQSSREKRHLFRRMAAGKLNPQGFETRMELGEIYVRARRWKKAIEELEQAVEIDGDHAHCRSLFGSALFRDGRYQEAVDNMEKALELRPTEGYGKTQVLLGRAYEALGNSEKAIEWYRAATVRNSSICEPVYRLALVHRREGDLDAYRSQLSEVARRFSAHDRTNYWKNLWFVLQAQVRLALGM